MPDWPNADKLLLVLDEVMEAQGEALTVSSHEAFNAGLTRAQQYLDDAPDTDLFDLAALVFDAVATRHTLLDGNKRLAMLAALTFLDTNGAAPDLRERDLFGLAVGVFSTTITIERLADALRQSVA